MDFWSRLLGGSAAARQSNPANPQQRLLRFKRVFDQIRQTYQKSPLLQPDSSAANTILTGFKRLTAIIQDESRAAAPHVCLQFAASAQIYTTISRIGAVAQHEGIIRETVAIFSALIDSEEEEFLASERFANAFMLFVDRTSGSGNIYVGEDTEGEIVELLFGIAAKIRLQPEILPVWFSNREQSRRRYGSKESEFVGVTSKEDFPLCYQLVDHVHHEGRIGDFARIGLLYIFESASKNIELEKWLVVSDMPTLMASGLGALYSQLSRKVSISHPEDELPIILKLSDYLEVEVSEEADALYSNHLQGHLATFLSYLTFWQDVLEHCRSVDVRQTLLDHFQVLFLQQLLYPSMLESSDVDGGSSVAVLTYIRHILEALDHLELVNLVLRYLLALPEPQRVRSTTALRRTSSLLLLAEPDNEDERMNPSLFNLIDLLHCSIDSANPQTVIAALKLATVIIGKNHPYAINSLLQTNRAPLLDVPRTHGALNAEVEAYMSLAVAIGGPTGLNEAYDDQLKDALRLIESHACSNKLVGLSEITGFIATKPLPNPVGPHEVSSHMIRLDDAFLTKLLSSLRTFLTNNVELNLALTESLITILICPHFRLEGWVAVDPIHYILPPSSDAHSADPEAFRHLHHARLLPTWLNEHAPKLMTALGDLLFDLELLKTSVPDLDALIASRKQAFRLHSEITDAMADGPPNSSKRSLELTQSGNIPATNIMQRPTIPPSASQRFLDAVSDAVSPSPSRSQSRGRQFANERRANITSSPTPVTESSILEQYAPGLTSPPSASSPSRSRHRGQYASEPMARTTSTFSSEFVVREQLLDDVFVGANDDRLKQRVTVPVLKIVNENAGPEAELGTRSSGEQLERLTRESSLGHILTNAMILQEFILEVVAVMQVRASMFGEVIFA